MAETERLRQIVTENRTRWHEHLHTPRCGWDWCILTAANERQALGYQLQIRQRVEAGLWPDGMRWAVVADPNGRRIGSGLATLHALLGTEKQFGNVGFHSQRVLILHCGGSSVRMPHCSAFGKVFAPLPVELTAGRLSTILDENLMLLHGYAEHIQAGVIAVSGDVLLALDPSQAEFHSDRVSVATTSAPAAVGEGHGVFQVDKPSGRVREVLQKYPPARLERSGAVDADGHVLIDTGLFYFPPDVAQMLLGEVRESESPLGRGLAEGVEVDIYTDLAEAMAAETDRAAYCGAVRGVRREVRERLWELLHAAVPLHISPHEPGAFFHLGSTADYCRAMAPDSPVGRTFGFERRVASDDAPGAEEATLMGCRCEASAREPAEAARGAVLDRCRLEGGFRLGRLALASRLGDGVEPFMLADELAAFRAPLRTAEGGQTWVTAIYGVHDNPKQTRAEGARFMNRPLAQWMEANDISPADLWRTGMEETLWSTCLFPLEEPDSSAYWLRWFQQQPTAEEVTKWRAARRVSFADILEMADCEAMVREELS